MNKVIKGKEERPGKASEQHVARHWEKRSILAKRVATAEKGKEGDALRKGRMLATGNGGKEKRADKEPLGKEAKAKT